MMERSGINTIYKRKIKIKEKFQIFAFPFFPLSAREFYQKKLKKSNRPKNRKTDMIKSVEFL